MYALQRVLINKTIPLDKAKLEYEKITKKKPRKIREQKNFYAFRTIPPNKFEKKSFRTKVVNKDIRLIYGKLLEQHSKLEGHGLYDYFSGAFNYLKNSFKINDYSNKTKNNLEKFGHFRIVNIRLQKVPVSWLLELALETISFGSWERLKQKYGFDKFFHLSMVVTLENQKQLQIEKLEVISVSDEIEQSDKMITLDVRVNGVFSIMDMFRKSRANVGDGVFFSYSALGNNNCQDFIKILLQSVGLYHDKEKEFIYQDISRLVKELPSHTKKVVDTITDLGAIYNKISGGNKKITIDELYHHIR